jgi:hypothetical protein
MVNYWSSDLSSSISIFEWRFSVFTVHEIIETHSPRDKEEEKEEDSCNTT